MTFIDRKCNSYLLLSRKIVASSIMNEYGFNGIYYGLKLPFLALSDLNAVMKYSIWSYSMKFALISHSEISRAELFLKCCTLLESRGLLP